ncbi:hypothetical protein [Sorangium sp. So ce1024]|uniref:hypothetical protein n=1 Tax=Sorangium sp. So ce1024 TaxID=3133327 RepID=UPI003EFEA8D4
MRYRDERDALRGRVDSLEEELATARKELEDRRDDDRAARVEQLERQMADARRVLDQLGRELDAVRGRPRRRPSAAILALIAGLGLCAAVPVVVLLRSSSEPPAAPVGAVAHPTPIPVPAEPPPVAPAPAPPKPTTPAPARPLRTATATWKATVTRATGLPLAAGAACTVEAELASAGDDIRVPSLQVVCGGKPIYRSSDPLNGMSMFSSGVEEEAGAEPGTHVYAIAYQDKGSRVGERAEISLDSVRRSGAVWRDTAPAYRVELTLAYQSPPVAGEPLLDATRQALRRAARVTESTGPSPVKAGARCAIQASPLPRGGKCLTRIACGGRMLYGAGTTGVAECTVEGDQVVRVHDGNTTPNGGDPALDLDVATGRVTVRDEEKGGAWTVGMQLDPAAGEGQ